MFSKCPELIFFLPPFQRSSLSFMVKVCRVVLMSSFSCISVSVSFTFGFMLKGFRKIVITLFFSGWPVSFVAHSKFLYRPIKFSWAIHAEQGFFIFSFGNMYFQCFLLPVSFAPTLTFPWNFLSFLLTTWYFSNGNTSVFFVLLLSGRFFVTSHPVSTILSFFCSVNFICRFDMTSSVSYMF